MITIYADGSCIGNPGPGGWAFLVLPNGSRTPNFSKNGGVSFTTNNQMELMAAIKALEYIKQQNVEEKVTLRTDSQYVKNGISSLIKSWKQKNWITSKNTEVRNKELWEQLDTLNDSLDVTWEWVKGHSIDVFNNAVDRLAKTGITTLK